MIYDSGHFFGNDGSGNGFVRFPELGVIKVFDLRVVLNRLYGDFGKSKFEIFIAVFITGFVFKFLVGVAGAGH